MIVSAKTMVELAVVMPGYDAKSSDYAFFTGTER